VHAKERAEQANYHSSRDRKEHGKEGGKAVIAGREAQEPTTLEYYMTPTSCPFELQLTTRAVM
jgi:hypothetical protein